MSKQDSPELHLALALHRKLVDATEKFCRIHQKTTVGAIKQAGNLFLASWIANANNRADAYISLDEEINHLREKIEQAPDSTFGQPVTKLVK